MRFDGLDLNLLVALDALLGDRSIKTAADRLHLSQPAMSGALARLREYFDDRLLVNAGNCMVLTPRAESLVEPVGEVLQQIRRSIMKPPICDPATVTRQLSILASDYVIRVALAPAMQRISSMAPGLSFDIGALADHPEENILRAETDLLITAEQYLTPRHPVELIFEDGYVVVAWQGNTEIDHSIDLATYSRLGHVTVAHGATRHPTFEQWFAGKMRIPRRIEVVAPAFSDAGYLLVGTQRISTMHARLATLMAGFLPLKICAAPFDIPTIRIAVQRHEMRGEDPLLGWVIAQIREAVVAPAAPG
jgi:DNA-binding transcriptional LysR family regulator